jgi:large subunit ribosomal protein L22
MEVKASLKNLRVSSQKTRLVVDLVRGLEVEKARNVLKFCEKDAKKDILKLLDTAIANAKNNFDLDEKTLKIKEVKVGAGKTLKRWTPKAQGSAGEILKRSCHVWMVLEGEKKVQTGKKKQVKKEEKNKKKINKK